MTNLEFQMRARTMQTLSFYPQRGQNFGVKEAFWITDRFKCTYACIMIYCSTCTLSKNVIHVRVGRKLGDSADILEMLKEIDKDASKSVACHYNLANYYTNQNRAIYCLSLYVCTQAIFIEPTRNLMN